MKPRLTKHGDYERRVDFPIFGFAVFVVFTEDIVKSIKVRYDQIQVRPSFEAMHCRELDNPFSHLFFKIGNATSGTISHECFHVMRFLLDDWTNCGVGNELMAYHLGYMVDRVICFRNDLIDNGVGVKSKQQEVTHAKSSVAQGDTTGVQSLHTSRFDRESTTEEGAFPDSEISQGSGDCGHCCP
jgi:hypothetical protein